MDTEIKDWLARVEAKIDLAFQAQTAAVAANMAEQLAGLPPEMKQGFYDRIVIELKAALKL